MEQEYKKIKLVAFDCDGVLTDNKLHYTEDTERGRSYNTSDAVGCTIFKQLNIVPVLLSRADDNMIVTRSIHMGLDYYFVGSNDKKETLERLCADLGFDLLTEVAYVGNDLYDYDLLCTVKFPFCPIDAEPEVTGIPNIVIIKRIGGDGVIKELASMIAKVFE